MREILKKLDSGCGFEDSEECLIMGNNILDTINGNEVDYCLTYEGSKVIERISGFAGEEKFSEFTSNIVENLEECEKLLSDNRSLFALESLLRVLTLRSCTNHNDSKEPNFKRIRKIMNVIDYNLNFDKSEEHRKFCEKSVENLSKIIISKFDLMIYDKNASHLLRSCIEALSGLIKTKNGQKEVYINLKKEHTFEIPEAWIEIIKQIVIKLTSSMKSKKDFTHNETASLVAQSVCQALKNLETELKTDAIIEEFCNHVMKKSYKLKKINDLDDLKKVLESASSVRLLEEMFSICDAKMLNEIYERILSPHLLMFCKSPDLNFTIQKFLTSDSISKETFEEIFESISNNFGEIIKKGHTGIFVAVSKSCEKLKSKQGQFIQSLSVALDCANKKSESFIYPLLTLKSDSKDIHLHGSVVVQNMLKFQKPIKIVQNLLEMKSFELANIFCDSKGSRVADAFMESKSIGEKNREKLVKHIEGNYLKLALSKNGAFVLEKLFSFSSMLQKEIIVKELSEKMNQMKGSTSGRILIHKFYIEVYLRNVNQWKSKVSSD